MLHAGNCVLGELLVGSQCCSCPSLFGCHYPAHNVNANSLYKQLPAARCLHQSHWCMDRGKCFLAILATFGHFGTFWEEIPDFRYFATINNSLPPVNSLHQSHWCMDRDTVFFCPATYRLCTLRSYHFLHQEILTSHLSTAWFCLLLPSRFLIQFF